jgi:diadenosine tetraphosphate (Ap4A) HIT family hydrolase
MNNKIRGQIMSFSLARQLENDTFHLHDFKLCRFLIMNDKNYPWAILVPKRKDIKEVYELSKVDQEQLWLEVTHVSKTLQEKLDIPKMNIAAIGNMVPQLHIHIVGRSPEDISWPKPVWGQHPALAYLENEYDDLLKNWKTWFNWEI